MPVNWAAAFKRPGQFIRDYLQEHGEASIAEMHQAFSRRIKTENRERKQQGRKDFLHGPTYHSFYAYFRAIAGLGLVERVGERETDMGLKNIAEMGFVERVEGEWQVVEGARERLWALTPAGSSQELGWNNPWGQLYPK